MTPLRQGHGGQVRRGGLASVGVAIIIALALAAVGVVRGTWAVGGSDSSCYALMAKTFAEGDLQPASALATAAPWPDASNTLAPGGFIASPVRTDAASPICAPGMSLLMAPLAAVFGQDAIFWLTPMAAAALVLFAFVIGRQLAGGVAGVTAAILTATSPIVLYQSVQPMNDIVTAALWLGAIALGRRSAVAGVMIGAGILVRPNLAPLAVVLALVPVLQFGINRQAGRALLQTIGGALPGVLVLLWLNHALYGSVIGSGYGDTADLFSAHYFNDNLSNYSRALFQTQHIVPAVALLAPLVFDDVRRKGALLLLGFAAVEMTIYLFYKPFPEWWYLRFLIPAIVVLLILASAATVQLLSRNVRGGLIPILAVLLGIIGTRAAGERQAFELQRMEARYRETAALVSDRLPANAVLITVWQSGSMRFHAGREIVMWDSLDPAWLDRAMAWLKLKGQHPYVLVERREEPDFRARFRDQSDIGRLDWPPRFDMNRQVRIYDPDDRARYLDGEAYPTENIRPSR
ncbi:MAG: hypothetical protein ABI024_02260 [Vicinamibacterales bacterium]